MASHHTQRCTSDKFILLHRFKDKKKEKAEMQYSTCLIPSGMNSPQPEFVISG